MVCQGTAHNLETPLSISATVDNIAKEYDARHAAPASRILLAECDDGLEEVRAAVHVAYGIGVEHARQPTLFQECRGQPLRLSAAMRVVEW